MANVKIEDSSAETKTAIREVVGFVGDNLMANVTLRTGTLTSLLAISNAGDGEVAVATDVNALVVYNGIPSVGVPHYNTGFRAFGKVNLDITSVPPATTVVLPLSSIDYESEPLFDIVNETITLPPTHIAGNKFLLKVNASFTHLGGLSAGKQAIFMLERMNLSGFWTTVLPYYLITGTLRMSINDSIVIDPAINNQLRLTAETDDSVNSEMVFANMSIELTEIKP